MPKNKPHKQKFSSKRSLADKQQGRKVSVKAAGTKSNPQTSDRERRQQAAESMRKKKTAAALSEKRIGSAAGPPRIVGVVPLNEAANSILTAQEIIRSLDAEAEFASPITVRSLQSKQRLTIVTESEGNEQDILDVAKVSDILVVILNVSAQVQEAIQSIDQGVDDDDEGQGDDVCSRISGSTWFAGIGLCVTDQTRELISLLNAQGAPTLVVGLQGLDSFDTQRKRQKVMKLHERYFTSVAAEGTRVMSLESEDDYKSFLRHCQTLKLRSLKWRDQHPYFVVENRQYDSSGRKLQISGFLRGLNISPNQLIHITNHGTFQIESIQSCGVKGDTTLFSPDELRESLQRIQASDTVEDEGKATEEDVHQVADSRKIRVPAGVSEYQAAWYEHENLGHDQVPITVEPEEDHFVDLELLSKRSGAEVDFLRAADVMRVERLTDEERDDEMRRLKSLSEEEMWNPDMVDTPVNLPARQRFSKYRGLKSFHGSLWDTNENLPVQYGHVFKLQNYSRIRDNAVAKCASSSLTDGTFITVTLLDVPQSVYDHESLLIASAQLEHEQKWSVLHFQVQRNTDLEEPVKSKTPMLAHIGFRKFYVSPLFSDTGTGDRTKYARYFHPSEKFRIASFFGPISYAPCPILLFLVPSLHEQAEDASLRLACFGSALPPNPDLLILKRTVLTGRVAMIHKKTIVVKYMFFNEDDVRWFQPVDIYTRLGRRGKISKAVGTKGLFKAALNDQIMQHDVICMDLYKRVFPKWTTVEFNVAEILEETVEEE